MGAAILIMLAIPFTNSSEIRSSYFRPSILRSSGSSLLTV